MFFRFHPYLGKWSNFDQYFFKWVETTTWFFSRPKPCQFRRQTDMVLRGLTWPPNFNSKPPNHFFSKWKALAAPPKKTFAYFGSSTHTEPLKKYTYIHVYIYIYIHIFYVIIIYIYTYLKFYMHLLRFLYGFPLFLLLYDSGGSFEDSKNHLTWRLKPKTSSGQTTASTSSNRPAESSVASGAAPARKGQWWMLGIGIFGWIVGSTPHPGCQWQIEV